MSASAISNRIAEVERKLNALASEHAAYRAAHDRSQRPRELNQAFDCWLYLTKVMADKTITWQRFVMLPFQPYEGMTLMFGCDDDDGPQEPFDFTPHHVGYVVTEDVFWCFAKIAKDCPCTVEEYCCVASKEHREICKAAGWEVFSEEEGVSGMSEKIKE